MKSYYSSSLEHQNVSLADYWWACGPEWELHNTLPEDWGFCACVNAIQDSSIVYALDNRSVAHVSFGNYLTFWVLNLQRMPVGILRLVSGFDHWIKTTFGSFTAWFVKIATLIESILLIVSFVLFSFVLFCCLVFCLRILFMRIVAGQVRSQMVLSGLADEVEDIDWDEWELSTALPYAVLDDKPQREEAFGRRRFLWNTRNCQPALAGRSSIHLDKYRVDSKNSNLYIFWYTHCITTWNKIHILICVTLHKDCRTVTRIKTDMHIHRKENSLKMAKFY